MNIVITNEGLNDLLSKYAKGSNYTAALYVGLTDASPTVSASDTLTSHPGWVEITAYSQATRPALVLGDVASQSIDNNASKAVFSINGSSTIGGAFITTDPTKGGVSGILYGVGRLDEGDHIALSGYTLNIDVTLTAANS